MKQYVIIVFYEKFFDSEPIDISRFKRILMSDSKYKIVEQRFNNNILIIESNNKNISLLVDALKQNKINKILDIINKNKKSN